MTDSRIRAALITASHLLAFALGWGACHSWERPVSLPVTEHAMVRGPGTQVLAARSATPVKPAQALPTSAKPQSTFHAVIAGGKPELKPGIVVDQNQASVHDNANSRSPIDANLVRRCQALLQCPAITVNGTVVTQKDGQPDLYLSTGGELVQHVEFHPGATVAVPPAHPNRISVTRWSSGGWTGAYERDLWGPVFAGVQAGQMPGQGAAVGVTLGARR